MSLPPSLWKVRYRTSYVWAWLGTSFFCTLQSPKSQRRSMEFNRSLVVAEIFNASCNANKTLAFIFLNACSTCSEEYQQSNIFRLSIVQALALKYLFGCGLPRRTWLVTSFSWCILHFPFFARGPNEKLGLPASHFFLEVELTHIHFLSKYQLALFFLTRSIFCCEHVGM